MTDGVGSRVEPDRVDTVTCVGAGVIGGGWAAYFLARGYQVRAWDPAPDAERRLRHLVDQAWPALTELGGADPDRNVGLTDYLLGQADPIGRADASRHLRDDPGDHALATALSERLREMFPDAEPPRLPGEPRQRRPALPRQDARHQRHLQRRRHHIEHHAAQDEVDACGVMHLVVNFCSQ